MKNVSLLLTFVFAAGCAQTRSYQVVVANHTDQPITVGLVKLGGPYERDWSPPEEEASANRPPSALLWKGIPPGMTASNQPVEGKFDSDARAVLRIYEGKLDLPGILAISRGQPNRIDILLHPGINRFTVTDQNGNFQATSDDDHETFH